MGVSESRNWFPSPEVSDRLVRALQGLKATRDSRLMKATKAGAGGRATLISRQDRECMTEARRVQSTLFFCLGGMAGHPSSSDKAHGAYLFPHPLGEQNHAVRDL